MKDPFIFYIFILMVLMTSCSGKRPQNIGIKEKRLFPCPDKPNCVSSFETGGTHGIKPLGYTGDFAPVMEKLAAVIRDFPRAAIVTKEGNYIHAEFKSLVFRFIDDVEFLVVDDKKIIHIRSASRTGYSDFGVNRKRIEKIRKLFQQKSEK
jgi:uncharacterized protein (DUF1499 family)